jgi:hypothetical protein
MGLPSGYKKSKATPGYGAVTLSLHPTLCKHHRHLPCNGTGWGLPQHPSPGWHFPGQDDQLCFYVCLLHLKFSDIYLDHAYLPRQKSHKHPGS